MSSQPAKRAQLAQVLTQPLLEADHQHTLRQLDEYVAAQLAGQPYATLFPGVATHLDACVECAAAYALLYELALAEAQAMLPLPVRSPKPNLDFLTQPSPPSLLDQLRGAIRRTGERISLQLTPALLPALRPAYAISTVRGPADEQRYGELLLRLERVDELAADWPGAIAIYRDAHSPSACLVEVTVEPPGRSWPDLAGIEVVLVIDQEQRNATTDPWGLASFEDVPVTALATMGIAIRGV